MSQTYSAVSNQLTQSRLIWRSQSIMVQMSVNPTNFTQVCNLLRPKLLFCVDRVYGLICRLTPSLRSHSKTKLLKQSLNLRKLTLSGGLDTLINFSTNLHILLLVKSLNGYWNKITAVYYRLNHPVRKFSFHEI